MRFSRRTAWDRTPNEMSRLLDAPRRDGVIDLTESNPTRAGLAPDARALADALSHDGNARYEPDPLGLREARETLCAWLAGRGIAATPDRVVLTASTSEAYGQLFKLLCDPGDAVMVPSPSYPLFDFLTRLESVEAASYRLRLDDRWHLDVDALAAQLPDNARAVLVVSPNNPTGSFLLQGEANELAALARERSMAVVSDEVFADFAWPGAPPKGDVLAAATQQDALAFALGGLSKACGLPQLKLGWIVLGGSDALVEEAHARLELVSDAYLSVATPVQRGLGDLLAIGEAFRDRVRECLARNLDALRSTTLDVLPADAGWYAIVRLADGVAEQPIVDALLERDRVLVHPGWLYDLPMPSLVVSLLTEERDFVRGIDTVSRAVGAR